MILLSTIIGLVTVLDYERYANELIIDHGKVTAIGDWLPFMVLWIIVIVLIRILYKRHVL